MKAKMVDDLVEAYRNCQELHGELDATRAENGESEYNKLVQFLESIGGKEVELVFAPRDAFEKNDNNYWLPDSLWLICRMTINQAVTMHRENMSFIADYNRHLLLALL